RAAARRARGDDVEGKHLQSLRGCGRHLPGAHAAARLAEPRAGTALRGRHMRWPQEARCVVFLSVDLDGVALERGEGVEPLGSNSYGVYAYRCGVPRYLRLFERYGLRITFFVPGFDGEVAPEVIKAVAAHGHEVAAHGYCHEGEYLEGEEERSLLRRTHEILT